MSSITTIGAITTTIAIITITTGATTTMDIITITAGTTTIITITTIGVTTITTGDADDTAESTAGSNPPSPRIEVDDS